MHTTPEITATFAHLSDGTKLKELRYTSASTSFVLSSEECMHLMDVLLARTGKFKQTVCFHSTTDLAPYQTIHSSLNGGDGDTVVVYNSFVDHA